MKIVFISNYFNHHQRALSQALYRLTGGNYRFIATSEMREERKVLGYGQNTLPEYVCLSHKSEENMRTAMEWIRDADAVIAGSAPEAMLKQRIKEGKLIFRYAERPLKKGDQLHLYLPRFLRWHLQNPAGKPIYMLAASAYTARDYGMFGLYRGKTYKWGYFPEAKKYSDLSVLFAKKDPQKILWCGRFIDWKHPDDAIRMAKRLKDSGCRFSMDMIGSGVMAEQLQRMISDLGLDDCVHILGSMKPEKVREHMEKTGIFLFTSDRQEGWGAVLNESMNSGCAVVASHAIGAVPFLIEDNVNGAVYRSGDTDILFEKVKNLLENPQQQRIFAMCAYETISQIWNAENAAERLCQLISCIGNGNTCPDLYRNGPCSKAEWISENWCF